MQLSVFGEKEFNLEKKKNIGLGVGYLKKW